MLTIKTYLAKSDIAGIGVFTYEDIPEGTVTWVRSDFFDFKIKPESIANLSAVERQRFQLLDYHWIDQDGNYILSLDHDRFMNHSFNANILSKNDNIDVAARDIKAHEELTIDYRTIVPRESWETYFTNE